MGCRWASANGVRTCNSLFLTPTNMSNIDRKTFLKEISLLTGASLFAGSALAYEPAPKKSAIKLGMVTYLWGKDWDVPTIIKNCTDTGIEGVELRVEHAHKVEPELNAAQRQAVKKMFADSPVQLVGLGTNQQYDFVEPDRVKASIERTKEYIRLSADVGGSGVKVKPNALHKEVPTEKTLTQIGEALNELARYGAEFGQQIRLEVHGNETQELPAIKQIMDVATHPNAAICWNCNPAGPQRQRVCLQLRPGEKSVWGHLPRPGVGPDGLSLRGTAHESGQDEIYRLGIA